MARFHFPTPKANCSGLRIRDQFVRNDDPIPHLVKTGEIDFDDFIQSFADAADYVSILEKMMKGDPVATAKATAILGGSGREIPSGYVDDSKSYDLKQVYNSIQGASDFYTRLGGAKKLGMSFEEFLSNFQGFEPIINQVDKETDDEQKSTV